MPDSRRPVLIALVCGLAVFAARLAVAFAHQDTWYPFEIHAGSIACALLDGMDLDLASLPIVAHVRGSVLFGVLLVPIYALGGASSLTLKLLPALWNASSVGLLAGLFERYHSRRAAWSAGLLFAFAPPMLQKLSVLGLSSHLESALPYLLTWGAWLAWTRDGATRGRALRFGAALGFSAFFHLQALLPSLLLLALLALRERKRLLSAHGAWLVAGALLCGAPAFLFDGGAVVLLLSGVFTEDSGAPAEGAGGLAKLAGLAGGDLARALEFGGSAMPAGAWLGPLTALGLALGALCGFAALRRHGCVALFFPLHALLVVALYVASNLEVVGELGTGASNRHLAPLVVALLAFTASGAGVGRLGTATVLGLAALGALGYPAVVRASESARLRQRGECYEWFVRQLSRGTDGDPAALEAVLSRVDRGDRRFQSLRFASPVPGLEARAQALLSAPAPSQSAPLDAAGLLVWTALGRHLVGRVDELAAAARAGHLAALSEAERDALLHGVGLALQPPRARLGFGPVAAFVAGLDARLAAFPAEEARALAEGYGLQIGQIFDPYNRNLARTVQLHATLAPPHAAAFARGLGWGARQRYLDPPLSVPDGLSLPLLLEPGAREAFEEAFSGRVLPREAAVLGS